jgi:PAS domain S-box-containing protein
VATVATDQAPAPPSGGARGEGAVRVARGLQVVIVVMLVGFAISTIPGVRSTPYFVVWLDGWYQATGYTLMAVLAVLRTVTNPAQRLVWGLVTGFVVFRVLAFLWFWGHVRLQTPPPFPSASDAGWVLSGLLLLVAIGVRTGEHAPRMSRTVLLDALGGALLAAGLSTAIVYPLIRSHAAAGADPAGIAVNLAYPMLDLGIAIAAMSMLAVVRWRPDLPESVLLVGTLLFATVDVVYLYEFSNGTWHPGTWVAALSWVATLLIASAGWAPSNRSPRTTIEELRAPSIAAPVVVALVSVAALVFAGVLRLANVRVTEVALVLLFLAVGAAAWRGALTIHEDRRLLDTTYDGLLRFRALVEASSDFIAMGDLDYTIVYINPAGRRLIGLADDVDVRTVQVADFYTPEDLERMRTVSGPIVESGGTWSGLSTLRNLRGGPPVPVLVNTFLLRDHVSGRPVAMASIQRDVRELREAEQEVEELAEQRRRLLSRLVEAQEEERAKIAEDVHDDSVQALAAVDLRLGLLRRQLGEDHALAESAEKAHDAVAHATARLRHLLFDLESPARDRELTAALDAAAQLVFEDTGVSWSIRGDRGADLPVASRITAYRVVKEALVNVRKHAGATHVEITVEHVDEGVLVTVRDDGVGLDEELAERRAAEGHHGLSNMRDRVSVAGGRFLVHSLEGGTQVTLWLPDLER